MKFSDTASTSLPNTGEQAFEQSQELLSAITEISSTNVDVQNSLIFNCEILF